MAVGDVWGNRWLSSWGASWAQVGESTQQPDITPTLGGGIFGKRSRRRQKTIRFSDFAIREERMAAIREAIPIHKPPLVTSSDDLEDEDFIIINLLGLLND